MAFIILTTESEKRQTVGRLRVFDENKELHIETKEERVETIKVSQIPEWVLILWA